MISAKYDSILKRDLTSVERLADSFANIEFAKRFLIQLENKLKKTPNDLTDEQLETVDKAVSAMLHAVENAVFLGTVGYDPWRLETIEW